LPPLSKIRSHFSQGLGQSPIRRFLEALELFGHGFEPVDRGEVPDRTGRKGPKQGGCSQRGRCAPPYVPPRPGWEEALALGAGRPFRGPSLDEFEQAPPPSLHGGQGEERVAPVEQEVEAAGRRL
jgi:hypothetical protein